MRTALSRAELVIVGEFFLDWVFYHLPAAPSLGKEVKTAHLAETPGGGVATTALVAARLGTPTAVVARIGKDARQKPAWHMLEESGICTEACEFSERFPTAITVCAAYHGERMMITHDIINQQMHRLLPRKAVRRKLRQAKHLHLACTPSATKQWVAELRTLRTQEITISSDLGWNAELLRAPELRTLLRQCEFTFPNEVEAREITGEKTAEKAVKKLANWVRVPVIKLGEDGCIAVQAGKVLRMKSIKVDVVDATGAGDAFNGGFLHGYLSGWPLEDCLRAGNVCGAMAATAPGGSSATPSRSKLLQLMKRI
jgi:ribokinase